ncbi:MAG: hypothetical protein ACOYO1_18385 [Bacteroidales bacterium]
MKILIGVVVSTTNVSYDVKWDPKSHLVWLVSDNGWEQEIVRFVSSPDYALISAQSYIDSQPHLY